MYSKKYEKYITFTWFSTEDSYKIKNLFSTSDGTHQVKWQTNTMHTQKNWIVITHHKMYFLYKNTVRKTLKQLRYIAFTNY